MSQLYVNVTHGSGLRGAVQYSVTFISKYGAQGEEPNGKQEEEEETIFPAGLSSPHRLNQEVSQQGIAESFSSP